MRAAILIWAVTLWQSFAAAGETNRAPMECLLALPSLELRVVTQQDPAQVLAAQEEVASPVRLTDVRTNTDTAGVTLARTGAASFDQFSLTTRASDLEMRVYRRLEEGGYLTRREPETPLSHFMDRTFSPEEIHLGKGKAVAGCTLYTAIKRKNPLCLLNPLFLFVSW